MPVIFHQQGMMTTNIACTLQFALGFLVLKLGWVVIGLKVGGTLSLFIKFKLAN